MRLRKDAEVDGQRAKTGRGRGATGGATEETGGVRGAARELQSVRSMRAARSTGAGQGTRTDGTPTHHTTAPSSRLWPNPILKHVLKPTYAMG